MNAINFFRKTSKTVYNTVSSCTRRLPSIQINTTAKVALVALALLSFSQVASAKEPSLFATQCSSITTLSDDSGELLNLDFSQGWTCTDIEVNLATCFKQIDFSRFSCSSLATLMSNSVEFFGSFAKCLLNEGRITDSYTSIIDLEDRVITFIHELYVTQR